MTVHQHSAQTPSLAELLKSCGTFEARSQQRHILCHWTGGRQKELSFRREEAAERQCVNEAGKRQARREGHEEVDDLEVVQPTDPPKTCSHYDHIKKPQGAICRVSFQRFFIPRMSGTRSAVRGVFFSWIFCRFSCLFLPRLSSPHFFFSVLFPSPFPAGPPFLFSAVYTRGLLAAAVPRRSINARFLRW